MGAQRNWRRQARALNKRINRMQRREQREEAQELDEGDIKRIVDRAILQSPTNLPKSLKVDQLDVGDLRPEFFVDLEPGQEWLVTPPAPTEGQVLVYQPVAAGEPEVSPGQRWAAKTPSAPVSDGDPPDQVTNVVARGGPNFIAITWDPVAGEGGVTYEVYISTVAAFTPGAGTLVGSTRSAGFFAKTLQDGTALEYDTTYYIQVIATDVDGSGVASAEVEGTTQRINGLADIVAESVTASEILADEALFNKLNALLIIANTMATGETGEQRVVIDSQGIRLIDGNENTLVDIPTATGASPTFKGNVITGGLTVTGNAVIQGTDNEMDQGAALTLLETTADASTAPTVSRVWSGWTLDTPNTVEAAYGLFWDTAGGPTGAIDTFLTLEKDVGHLSVYIREYQDDTRAFVRELDTSFSGASANYGICRLGSHIYVLEKAIVGGDTEWYFNRYLQTDLSFVDRTNIDTSFQGNASLGTDGTDLLILWADINPASEKFKLSRYETADFGGASINETTTHATGIEALSGALPLGVVADDFGVLWIRVKNIDGLNLVYAVDPSAAYAIISNRVFTVLDSAHGIAYDFINFFTGRATDTTIIKMSQWDWTTESPNYWFAYAWADDVNDYETTLSPKTNIDLTWFRRSHMLITLPDLPDGADSARIYVGRGATEPSDANMWRQIVNSEISDEIPPVISMENFNAAGTNPEGNSTFPAASGAILRNERGTWQLLGDGSARGIGVVSTALRQQAWWYNECSGNVPGPGFSTGLSGAGATVVQSSPASEASHPGMYNLQTGTTATGHAFIYADTWQDGGEMRFGAWIKTPGALSTAAQKYTISVGPGISGGNRIIVKYTHDSNGGAWELECTTSGVGTSTDPLDDGVDGTVEVATNTWYFIEIRVTNNSVMVRIDDVEKVDEFTSNVPAGVLMSTGVRITKAAGTLNRTFDVDAIYLDHKFENER